MQVVLDGHVLDLTAATPRLVRLDHPRSYNADRMSTEVLDQTRERSRRAPPSVRVSCVVTAITVQEFGRRLPHRKVDYPRSFASLQKGPRAGDGDHFLEAVP